ncbi:HET-domain-containing protein, partial [Eremomyces bilateralis CBS 781.70]
PKRLINVGDESQIPFLVESSPSSQQVTWLSLSYCWGQEPSVKLSLDNLDALKRGIPLETLDRTIQDAILVSRALNIPYIWIDALCITQDDDGKDWTEQAPKMSEIYGGSVLTLVVASEESVKDGFLKERELRYIPIPRSSNQPDNFNDAGPITKVFLSPEWDKSNDHINGHWTNRGWTMQEGLLPSRLLHYTSSQMIWKCHEEIRFERGVTQCLQSAIEEVSAFSDDIAFGSGWIWKLDTFMIFKILPRYLPGNLDSRLLLEPETFRLWYNLIEEYTPRRFKNISDRLVAISGLAQVFGNMIRCREYVAGLWKPDLIRGLMWHVEGAKLVPRRSTETMRAVNADFPSWSWAS